MTYPIITQKVLSPVPKSGILGLRPRSRDSSEIPSPTAGQVLVFKSGGRYVLDSGRLRLDDEIVVEATNVSVVDVTESKQVRVELSIPSAEGGTFTVGVDFICQVHDPVAVVKAGHGDIRGYLAAYLRAHDDVFQVGAKYKLAEFVAARIEVRAELQAYNHYVPVRPSGMSVTLGNVEIPAPPEIQEYLGKVVKDDLDHQGRLADLARSGNYHRAYVEEEAETRLRKLELEVLSTPQEIAKLRSLRLKEAERERSETEALAAEHLRRDMEVSFGIEWAKKVTEAVGDNPLIAHGLAAAQGEISARELAAIHQQEADRLYALERLREDREHEDRVKDAQLSRDTKVQGIMMRLEVIKEMVQRGLLDERGYKEIDGVLAELAMGNVGELPIAAKPDRQIKAPAEAEQERSAGPQAPPESEDSHDDVPCREEDL